MIIDDEIKEFLNLDSNDVSAFEIIGISKDASFQEIRKKFKKMAAIYHPDKNKNDPFFNKLFQVINEAYQEITNIGIRERDALYALSESANERQFCLLAFRAYCFGPLFKKDITNITPNINEEELFKLSNQLHSIGSKIINKKFDDEKEEILSREIKTIKFQPSTPEITEKKPRERKVTFAFSLFPRTDKKILEDKKEKKIVLLRDVIKKEDIRRINIEAFRKAQERGRIPDPFIGFEIFDILGEEEKRSIEKKYILDYELSELEIYCPELTSLREDFIKKYKESIKTKTFAERILEKRNKGQNKDFCNNK